MSTMMLIGGAGFIGSNLSKALRDEGHRVHATSATKAPRANGDLYTHLLNVRDFESVTSLVNFVNPDTIIHLASRLYPASSEEDYLQERREIQEPMMRLAGLAADKGIQLIYFSSGGAIYGPTSKALLSEIDLCRPISYYGLSKLETESYLSFLERTRGLRCLTIRPSNPFGRGQSLHGTQGLISVVLGKAMTGGRLNIWGDGLNSRDYIYIDDLTDSVVTLVRQGTVSGLYNVGSGEGRSVNDVVRVIEEIIGKKIECVYHPRRESDIPHAVLDVSAIKAAGALTSRSLHEGIRDYVNVLGLLHDRN